MKYKQTDLNLRLEQYVKSKKKKFKSARGKAETVIPQLLEETAVLLFMRNASAKRNASNDRNVVDNRNVLTFRNEIYQLKEIRLPIEVRHGQ